MEERLAQLDFSTAVDRVRHCSLPYKLGSIGVGEQLLFIVSNFLSGRMQQVRLGGKDSAPADVISGVSRAAL